MTNNQIATTIIRLPVDVNKNLNDYCSKHCAGKNKVMVKAIKEFLRKEERRTSCL